MSLPDLATDPDAVLKDDVSWRFKRAPDYSKTRKYYEESEYPAVPSQVCAAACCPLASPLALLCAIPV